MRHANISIFVPHVGCRHRCSFCDQNAITGIHSLPSERDVDEAVERAGEIMPDAEIAFFGGSFTAIERDYMLTLLRAAYKYVKSGKVRGIRVSTRPDAIEDVYKRQRSRTAAIDENADRASRFEQAAI